jgi:hypothetical protein
MNLQPTIDYLTIFFKCHIREYHEMRIEAVRSGNRGREELYEGQDEAVQIISNVVLGVEDEFEDMSIPGNYPTPNALLQRFEAYRDLAATGAKRIAEIVEAGGWYTELTYAAKITNQVADAIAHALTLSDIKPITLTPVERLSRIATAMPSVARQLLKRRNDAGVPRPTLTVNDEYDVQDLLHSLLHIEFSDIRAEESTPSYAATTKRIDFLLYPEEILIEVKKTRAGLKQREVVNELTIDIATYKAHPKAKHLVCVIWDVDNFLQNPVALKTDIEKANPGSVTVLVVK